MESRNVHATEQELALHAGGELRWFARRRVSAHLKQCGECQRMRDGFADTRVELLESDALPECLHWDRLSREMTANIRLGLAAGECVAQVTPRSEMKWQPLRPAGVLAGAVLVVALAWFANRERPQIPTNLVRAPQTVGVVLAVSTAGIDVNDNGRVLTLLHPKDSGVAFSVNVPFSLENRGSVRARYIDAESGQVTINNVYVQ